MPCRSMIAPRRETIVHREKPIVRRVEKIVPRHQVYRPLRAVDRDAWLREEIARFADPIASMSEAIARSADPIVWSSRSGTVERASRARVERIVRRDQTIRRVGPRIAPTEKVTRPHEWTIVHDASAIARHDHSIGRPAHRIVPRGEMIRYTDRPYRSLSRSTQWDGLDDHTAPRAERTVRYIDRTAWKADCTARSADPTSC